MIGVCEILFKPGADPTVYSYRNKIDDLRRAAAPHRCRRRRPPATTALAAWRALGCRDAGRVDIRCDAGGIPNFIECNPLAGLRPGWSELTILAEQAGMSYNELIGTILAEARTRVASSS